MKKVSFVILSWNSEEYLNNCIESIRKFKKIDYEIIVVDNGSKDKSISILENFERIDTKVRLIKLDRNYGTTISRNKGLHLINNTDFICILDSDTEVNENAIASMIDELIKDDKIGLIGPSMKNANGEKQKPFRKFPTWKIKLLKACPIKTISLKGEKLEAYDLNSLPNVFECDYLISACWLMRKEVYDIIGDLDEKIFYAPEDVEYCMNMRMNGYKVVHIRNAEILHHYQRISKKKLISKANITHIWGINYVLHKYKSFLKQYRKEKIN